MIKMYKKHEEIINYLIVGVLTTILSVGVKWGLLFTILDAKNPTQLQIAIILSWICAVTFAYVANRFFVFKSKNEKVVKEAFKFFESRIITLLIEALIMWFFITFLELNNDTWVLIWTMVTQVVVTVLNYVFSKLLVFNKKKEERKRIINIKSLLLGIGVLIGTIFLGWGLMILTYAIPNNSVQQNIRKSIPYFEKQSNWPDLLNDYSSTKLDNYTDAIILSELYYTSNEHSIIEKSLRVYGNYSSNEPVRSLVEHVSGIKKYEDHGYERYWHGNLFVIKILMIFFDYSSIRVLNMFIIAILLLLICKWLKRRNREKFIVPFIISILFINPLVISLSFQFCASFYIMLIGVLVMLKYKDIFDRKGMYPYYFLLIGMSTSFFDFLTYPIITLGVLLIIYVVLDDRQIEKDKYWLYIIKKIIFYSLLWGLGYGIMWGSKWVLSSLILHEDMIKNASEQIVYRTGIANNFSRFDAIIKNITVFNRPAYYFILIIVAIYYIIKFIKNKEKIKSGITKKIIPYGVIALMPFCWYFVLSNHSYVHFWFTYRSLIVFIMACLFLIEEFFEEKLEE